MMNNSGIEWCDRSWNPITGCLHDCPYCYARKQARRFCGDIRLNMASPQVEHLGDGLVALDKPFHNVNDRVIPMPAGFAPTIHKYRLADPGQVTKKSLNIFVGSMADVFGEWVPEEWIKQVLEAVEAAPLHHYLFLTKNPKRYKAIDTSAFSSRNKWYGATVTGDSDRKKAWDLLTSTGKVENSFLSVEPLLEPLDLKKWELLLKDYRQKATIGNYLDWVIVGAETGSRTGKVVPRREWVAEIVDQCRAACVPVFLKDNLADVWGASLIQEFPASLLPRPKPRPRHRVFVKCVQLEKYCTECGQSVKGKEAYRMGGRKYCCKPCNDRLEGVKC